MTNLYTINTNKESFSQNFSKGELLSVAYHDIFDFPLTTAEMIRWRASENAASYREPQAIVSRKGFYFKEGADGIVFKRLLRKRISQKKLEIARRATAALSMLPTVKMVAVTGSLAMENATDESDIDLMIVTAKGKLWTTRAFAYLLICLFGIQFRRAGNHDERDRLCLNIWLDEADLMWKKGRNLYTAHELAQIVPLVNKDQTYEKLLFQNRWILKYWPNAVRIQKESKSPKYDSNTGLFEKLAYKIQFLRMKSKITRETVTSTRALFHPQDWGKVILNRLSS